MVLVYLHTYYQSFLFKETTGVLSKEGISRSNAFTLGVGEGDDRYTYRQMHLKFEIDFLTDLIEEYKPNFIVNFAALAYATSWYKSSRYYDTNVSAVSQLCQFLYDKNILNNFFK